MASLFVFVLIALNFVISAGTVNGTNPSSIPSFPFRTSLYVNTNMATVGYQTICTTACAGQSLDFSTCGSDVIADSYLRLFDNTTNSEVAVDDDGCIFSANPSALSRLRYDVTQSGCRSYCLHTGCFGSSTCNPYTVTLTNYPTSVRPTIVPTRSPTIIPFPYITGNISNTNSALQNCEQSCVTLCQGDLVQFSTCDPNNEAVGDSYLRLYNHFDSQVAANDDSCGTMSRFNYRVEAAGCNPHCLRMGCFAGSSCHYTVEYSVLQSAPTAMPTSINANQSFPHMTHSMTNTNYATQNYEEACEEACPGDILTFSTCSSSPTDSYLRLWSQAENVMVAVNDDGCPAGRGGLSLLTYTVDGTTCRMFCLHMGCYGLTPCTSYAVEMTHIVNEPSNSDGHVSNAATVVTVIVAVTCILCGCFLAVYYICGRMFNKPAALPTPLNFEMSTTPAMSQFQHQQTFGNTASMVHPTTGQVVPYAASGIQQVYLQAYPPRQMKFVMAPGNSGFIVATPVYGGGSSQFAMAQVVSNSAQVHVQPVAPAVVHGVPYGAPPSYGTVIALNESL